MIFKKIGAYVLTISMLLSLVSVSALAADGDSYDLATAPVEITEAGTYTITQTDSATATANQIIITGDIDVTLNLVGVNIAKDQSASEAGTGNVDANLAPIEIIEGANVTLELDGDSIVSSARRYAGIHVDEDSILTIQDENGTAGSLTATGGMSGSSFGGGAGIGGNGMSGSDTNKTEYATLNFGEVNIESGIINATAGDCKDGNFGGGSAIGSGGGIRGVSDHQGTINISGGEINATSDSTYSNGAGGGAAIGAGAARGSGVVDDTNSVEINITGGDITAIATGNGAGIGGGDNVGSGVISITGGTVYAETKKASPDQGEYAGAAAIGSGDLQDASDITIGGDADVTAIAEHYGAGIGSGNQGTASNITIEGDAVVDATGGYKGSSIGAGNYGSASDITIGGNAEVNAAGGFNGAGIGNGYSYTCTVDGISIEDNAYVIAVGGSGGSGIGTGAFGEVIGNGITIQDSATVSAFGNGGGAGIGGGYGAIIQDGVKVSIKDETRVLAQGGGGAGIGFGCKWAESAKGIIEITDTPLIIAISSSGTQAIGYGSGFGTVTENPLTLSIGETATDIWLFNADDSINVMAGQSADGTALADDYLGAYTSAGPVAVWYNDDKATDFPTSGDAYWDTDLAKYDYSWAVDGDELIISDKTNNRELKSFDMTLLPPDFILSNWATFEIPSVVYTVSYELDGGTCDTIPADTTYETGKEVTVTSEIPTKSGYKFIGWAVGETAYEAGDIITVAEENITLTAQWKKKSSTPIIPSVTIPDDKTPTTETPELNRDDHFAYIKGYPDETFGQQRNITRAETVVMFSRLLTETMDVDKTYESEFTDISATDWFANQVGYMEQYGIVSGYEDGTFRGNEPITRAEFAAIASRFDELAESDENIFSDVLDSHWATSYINSAAEKEWINGYPDGTFKPEQFITRAEAVTLVNNVLERICDEDFIEKNIEIIKQFIDIDNSHWAYYDVMEATNAHDYEKVDGVETWIELN